MEGTQVLLAPRHSWHPGTPGTLELLKKFNLLNERGKVTEEDGIDTSGVVVLFKNL